MDWSIGKLMEKLSETGMLENSIIIFFSDNGAPSVGEGPNYSSGWPLRGVSSHCYIFEDLF